MFRLPSHFFFGFLAVILFTHVGSATAFCQESADLTLPVFEPRPLVLIKDWKPSGPSHSSQRKKALGKAGVADQLKANEKYDEAEIAYLEAMRLDPSWAYPPYQLACNYELSDQHRKAVPVFTKAIELGFADFPTALEDNELGKLRDDANFKSTLTKMRERYVHDIKELIGTPAAVIPKADKPDEGWPLMLLLHGYGDSNENYLDFAEQWASLGFVAVAVPGTVPSLYGGYTWHSKSAEPTLKDLRAIVSSKLLAGVINKDKVFLLGFSQGALHSILLAAEHRDEFAGVVALSPGGSIIEQIFTPKLSKGRPGRLAFLYGSEEGHAPIEKQWASACSKAGWKYMSEVHQGGHHFPRDWSKKRPAIAKFLTQ